MPLTRAAILALLTVSLVLVACAGPPPEPPPGTGQPPGIALPPEWTDTPVPTEPPPTLTPTITPPFGLAYATPVPVDREFDGWVRLESKSAALWMPPGFEGTDLGEFGDLMALMAYAMTEAMGEMASAFVTPVPGRPTPTIVSLEELQQTFRFDFVLAGSEADQAALFVVGNPPEQGLDLGKAMEEALDGFEGEVFVDDQNAIADRPYPTARLTVLVYDAETEQEGKHLLYVFVIDDRAWELNYAAPSERFDDLLPLFEKSAASFELKPGG
ncbi:MAG TPA: hypothetical protein VLL77_14225 [Anaerolineales bacterium]|nr:hypothetical protein [Anaerolineales bacterium]